MTTIEGYEFPDDLFFTKDHIWVKAEGNQVTIGLSDFGQGIAGDILFIEMPNIGRKITKDEAFMSMESGKWVGRVKAPISGTVAEANEELEWETNLVNSDPYGEGWLAKITASDLSELDTLLTASSPELKALIAEEKAKYNK